MDLSARWILIDIPPGTEPPCQARLGFQSTSGPTQVLGDLAVQPCRDVPHAIDCCLAAAAALGLPLGAPFSLIYPRYPVDGPLEAEMHEIAWVIKEAADTRGWEFDRELPVAVNHLGG
jgi:hypothetical protein